MSKRTTLRDIAKHADVSVSTVSQVLNNRAGVTAQTRQAVLRSAEELAYQPTVRLNSPGVTPLKSVGLLTKRDNGGPLRINPFYSYILAGAEAECQRWNISMMYANIDVDDNNYAQSLPEMLLDDRVDGVIVVGAFLESTIGDISHRAHQNLVLVDAYTSEPNVHDSVLINNFEGAIQAVTCLLVNGHRKIGLIGSNADSYPSSQERRRGYLRALSAYGVKEHFIEDGRLDRADAAEATVRLLRRSPEITAIFACNDNVAIGVINAIHQLGLRIPDDISVIGFDDVDLASAVSPALTTIRVDKAFVGALAVRHLRDRAIDPGRAVVKTLVSNTLVERDSVRNISA